MELIIVAALAFLAATLLPVASEGAVAAAIWQSPLSYTITVVLVAGLANTLGSSVNYALGRYLNKFRGKRWFYFSDDDIAKAELRFKRYGVWSLAFAWLPIIGDVLTLVAGVLRVRLSLFIALVLAGKTGRYALVAMGTHNAAKLAVW